MHVPCKFSVVSTVMSTVIATASTNPVQLSVAGATATQIAALAPGGASPNAIRLPNLTVFPPGNQPYTSRSGPRGGSANTVTVAHFRVWAGYDANVALHPYTSNLGPGAEAAPIRPSHYERAPFTD
jgi:hypothetical protein